MSTVYEQIRERIDGVTIAAPRTAAALLAAVDRHKPVPRSPLDGGDGSSCPVCVELCAEIGEHTCARGNVEAPCDEIKTIAQALGVDGD